MARRGGMSHIHYKETKGLKVGDGQLVKAGTILTRKGDKWKAGINTAGLGTIYALKNGTVYFTRKKTSPFLRKLHTFINIKEVKQKR